MCCWAPGLDPLSDYPKLLKKSLVFAWYLYIKAMANTFKGRFLLGLIFLFASHQMRDPSIFCSEKTKAYNFPLGFLAYLPLEKFV